MRVSSKGFTACVLLAPALSACLIISTSEYAGGGDKGSGDSGPTPNGDGEARTDGTAGEAGPGADLGNGDGHGGDKTIIGEATINDYAAVTAVATDALDLDDVSNFTKGDAILAWQTTTTEPVGSGATNVDAFRVGRYELARITAVTGQRISLDRTLKTPLSTGAQVVRVPELTTLTVAANARLTARAWDGTKGGIVAVLVQGAITIDGVIDVSGEGLRGGTTFQENNLFDCDGRTDGKPVEGYAAKGEGLVATSYLADGKGDLATAPGGRGQATIGGSGGHCHNAGGGGGGNGSAGGKGGFDWAGDGTGDDVGGFGGVAIAFTARERIILGGGGGAGDRHAGLDTRGGNGGGAVWLRADTITVKGSIEANGAMAPVKTDHDGAGGSGAGGTIALFARSQPSCATAVRARGADGASSTMSNIGPGGGGGGGHVLVAPSNSSCPVDVSGGVAGVQANASATGGLRHGATPETRSAGVVEAP